MLPLKQLCSMYVGEYLAFSWALIALCIHINISGQSLMPMFN